MTIRITAQMIDNSTVNTIDTDLNALDQTQEELSTGYSINEPSDNPYGAAESLSLDDQISAYTQYTQNINEGTSWVETASTALQSIQQVAETVSEVTEEAANGTENASDLQDTAQEVLQYIGQIKETANTQYDGSYVFGGSDVTSEPWDDSTSTGTDAFSGNTDSISYVIGPSTQLSVSANLYSVLGDGNGDGGAFTAGTTTTSGGTTTTTASSGGLLSTMRAIYSDLEAGDTSDLQTQMTNLSGNMSSLEALQAQVGATQDRLQMASSWVTNLSTTAQTELGNVEDTNEAQATTEFSTQQSSYQAALQSTADIIQTSLLNFLSTS